MQLMKKIMYSLRSFFLSGLFTIFPIGLTLFFVSFVYNFVYHSLSPLRNFSAIIGNVPGVEFFIATVLILLVGVIVRFMIISTLVEYGERLITQIPIISIVYSSAKIIADFFKVTDTSEQLKRNVVLVQYPRPGWYNLAFLLERVDDSYAGLIKKSGHGNQGERYFKVFMPTAPNPTTGYFFIVSEAEIIHTPITFEEGIKTLVSCGLITPDSLKQFAEKKL